MSRAQVNAASSFLLELDALTTCAWTAIELAARSKDRTRRNLMDVYLRKVLRRAGSNGLQSRVRHAQGLECFMRGNGKRLVMA